jgi:hypothetical protein
VQHALDVERIVVPVGRQLKQRRIGFRQIRALERDVLDVLDWSSRLPVKGVR